MSAGKPLRGTAAVSQAGAMRILALLALLPACVFLGTPPPQTAPPTPPPVVRDDFAGLFGGQSVRTLWYNAVDREGLMDRVVMDEETFQPWDDESGTEPWTLQLLLSKLGMAGSVVLTEPLGPPPTPRFADDGTFVAPPAPTAALRGLRFLSGTDLFPAVVEADGAGVQVRARVREDEPSLCPKDFALPVGFVYLRGTLQKLPLGEVVAVYDELALTPAPAETSIELVLPPSDDPRFCGVVAAEWDHNAALAKRDAGYIEAAGTVLDMALGPVLP